MYEVLDAVEAVIRAADPAKREALVDKNGIIYCTDWSGAGLHIMEYTG
jgi:hypothetical protein